MNSYFLYSYLKTEYELLKSHDGISFEILKLSDVKSRWLEAFRGAQKSIFVCGGELRSVDNFETAHEFGSILKEKLRTSDFLASVLCGAWLYTGEENHGTDDPIMNGLIREIKNIAKDYPEQISIYINKLNAVETAGSGYFHNVVIDEDVEGKGMACIECPHGYPQEGDYYADDGKWLDRDWIVSSDTNFIRDVVGMRNSFIYRLAIKRLTYKEIESELVARTYLKEKFFDIVKGWQFEKPLEFDECRKNWEEGKIHHSFIPECK